MDALARIQSRHPFVDVEVRHWRDPNYSDPRHPLFGVLRESAREVTGAEPRLSCSLAGTDLRFWRRQWGTPCAVYGPVPHNLATEDEYVTVADLVTVTKVHAVTLTRLLGTDHEP
jgi:acetylornithine deacetylase/succinyl-diaminopimelate desuccinylase-like protein